MHEEHPEALSQLSSGHAYDMSTNIFERLPQIFYDENQMMGRNILKYWDVRKMREYINT